MTETFGPYAVQVMPSDDAIVIVPEGTPMVASDPDLAAAFEYLTERGYSIAADPLSWDDYFEGAGVAHPLALTLYVALPDDELRPEDALALA